MSALVSNALSLSAVALSLALYALDWSYVAFFYYMFGPPLVLAVCALARGRAAAPRGGDGGHVLASLALGTFVAVIFGNLIFAAFDPNSTSSPRYWESRCGVEEAQQFWRILKDTWVIYVPLAPLFAVGAGWRIVRDHSRSAARRIATLVLVACACLLTPVTCFQIGSEFTHGVGGAVAVGCPLLCALYWTAGSWTVRRRAVGARPLRLFVALELALAVIGSTLFAREPACLHGYSSGTWHLLSLRQLGGAYLAIALVVILALDPPPGEPAMPGSRV